MPVTSLKDIGALIRKSRKEKGLTQMQAATFCGTGIRFFSDLENGKTTVQAGMMLQVLQAFGLELELKPRKRK